MMYHSYIGLSFGQDFFSKQMVQLDSVRPLLDTVGTRNLALVTAALQVAAQREMPLIDLWRL